MQRPRRALTWAKSWPYHRIERASSSVISGPTQCLWCAFSQAKIGAFAPLQAGFSSGRVMTDATLLACVYSGQIGAFAPHQVDFSSGHVVTDATLLACVYSGQIGAFAPHQADFTFGRVVTDATLLACVYSGQIGALRAASRGLHLQSCRDRRNTLGVHLLRPNRGPSHRIKRASPSVTMISDRLGLCALNAVRAVTYPAEGHLEDYASLTGVA
jgi:hypothetical protein